MNTPMYEDFLSSDDDIYQFETDMGNGKYKEWINRFPEHKLSIFGSLLCYYGNFVKEEDIIYFVDKGIDLNIESNVYPSDYAGTTPLIYACEHRYENLIKYLLKHGADVNFNDQQKMCPLESVFLGHNPYALERVEETEKCVRILIENGSIKQLKGISDDEFHYIYDEYIEKSPYLKNVISDIKFDVIDNQ
jgi:ankyrin repeat protein